MVRDPDPHGGGAPDTPDTDDLLRRFLVNWTASIEAHGPLLGGHALRRANLAAVDVGRPTCGDNVATLLAPLAPEGAVEVTAVLDDFYRFSAGGTTGAVSLFNPWPTPDLRPHGWTLMEHPPLMHRPAGGAMPPPPPPAAGRPAAAAR